MSAYVPKSPQLTIQNKAAQMMTGWGDINRGSDTSLIRIFTDPCHYLVATQ